MIPFMEKSFDACVISKYTEVLIVSCSAVEEQSVEKLILPHSMTQDSLTTSIN